MRKSETHSSDERLGMMQRTLGSSANQAGVNSVNWASWANWVRQRSAAASASASASGGRLAHKPSHQWPHPKWTRHGLF
ncbi:uncharacterized protein UV8b_01340 [Ustilaginoidea virens]|uniref:Uncharacterized protein n=1 Tax=Ustilaginoidea virens TaxID=1159556 RepID=A0A8E5HLE1_USTVR|nr:uncharacterized protein UV8b_01340 [Ustilaginoidea virens]QUC17099.1 hypothetical protein UV8b_01340 [Ustilaginoidea virens]